MLMETDTWEVYPPKGNPFLWWLFLMFSYFDSCVKTWKFTFFWCWQTYGNNYQTIFFTVSDKHINTHTRVHGYFRGCLLSESFPLSSAFTSSSWWQPWLPFHCEIKKKKAGEKFKMSLIFLVKTELMSYSVKPLVKPDWENFTVREVLSNQMNSGAQEWLRMDPKAAAKGRMWCALCRGGIKGGTSPLYFPVVGKNSVPWTISDAQGEV